MVSQYWTFSNLLSAFRAVLAFPIGYLILKDATLFRWEITILILIASLTDYADGFLARKLNQVTETGKILDPIADKIAISIIIIALIIIQRIPLWFGVLVIFRDLTIMLGSYRIMKMKKVTLQSNWVGKWTVTILAFYILSVIVLRDDSTGLSFILLVASTIMVIVSFGIYLKRYISVIKE